MYYLWDGCFWWNELLQSEITAIPSQDSVRIRGLFRITKDYEEQVLRMKNAVRKQAARCEALQRKLDEVENGGDVKMQQLTAQHKQKVPTGCLRFISPLLSVFIPG